MAKIESTEPISVVIIEDDPLVQLGLQQVLKTDPLLTIVALEKTAEAGLAAVEISSPDVVILDLGLPDKNGIKIVPQIRDSQIIVLTSQTHLEQINLALSLGVKGYCIKGISIDRLRNAIRLVAGGDTYIDPQIAELIVEQIDQKQNPSEYNLTNRECDVLKLVAASLTNYEIAESLNLSPNTVKRYVKDITIKLGARNRTDLAIKSLRSGLVD